MTAWICLSLALATVETAAGTGLQPATARFEAARRDELFGRALLALQRRGALVAAMDRQSGLIATRATPVADVACGSGSCRAREAVQILLDPSGEASVRIVREARGYYAADVDGWYSLDGEQSVQIGHQQALLLAEILGLPPPTPPQAAPAPARPAVVNPSGRDPGERCQADAECKSDACFRGYCMPRK